MYSLLEFLLYFFPGCDPNTNKSRTHTHIYIFLTTQSGSGERRRKRGVNGCARTDDGGMAFRCYPKGGTARRSWRSKDAMIRPPRRRRRRRRTGGWLVPWGVANWITNVHARWLNHRKSHPPSSCRQLHVNRTPRGMWRLEHPLLLLVLHPSNALHNDLVP